MSTNRVMQIIKMKNNPELYAAEQQEKEAKLKETLAFVDGVLAGLEREKETQEEIKKAGVLFVSDPSSPHGFKPKGK